MTYCTKCGAAVGDGTTFCGSCGTQVIGTAAQAGVGSPLAPAAGIQVTGLTSNVAAALTYLFGFITGIIFLVIEPYNKDPFVRFNAFQSIFLSVFYIVFSMVFGMLFLGSLGFLFTLIALALRLVELAFFLLWLFLMYKAYKNERYSLPIIGPLAAKQAG